MKMTTKIKIKDVMSPVEGLFAHIPNTIWGDRFYPEDLDIEFFTKYSNLYLNPHAKYYVNNGVLDVEKVAGWLYRKYGRSWEMEFTALYEDYNMFLTSRMNETITNTRTESMIGTDGEVIDNTGTQDNSINNTNHHSKSGSIDRSLSGLDTFDTQDNASKSGHGDVLTTGSDVRTNTKDLTNTSTLSGTDTVTNTTAGTQDSTVDLSKTGSEVQTGALEKTVDLTRTDNLSGTDLNTTNNTGTVNTLNADIKYGFGELTPVNSSGTDSTRTDDTSVQSIGSSTSSGTVKNTGTDATTSSDELSFTNRHDITSTDITTSGTDNTSSLYGKVDTAKQSGTDIDQNDINRNESHITNDTESLLKTGTVAKADTETTSFTDYKEIDSVIGSNVRTDNLKTLRDGKRAEDREITATQVTDREADSPLQTTQQLIREELEVRQHNYVDLVMESIRKALTLSVWGDIDEQV